MTSHAGWKRTEAGGFAAYVHPTLGRVEQVRKRTYHDMARWRAVQPNGEAVRVNKNADGSDYVARPWHTDRDRPVVHYFTSARLARRALGSDE